MQNESAELDKKAQSNKVALDQFPQISKNRGRMSANFEGRTLYNSISVIIGWLIPSVIFMFLTPYLVNNIGKEAYGVFTLTTVLTGYISFMDFGFGDAVTKHTAQYAAVDDWNGLTRTVSAGLVIFIVIGFVGGLILFSLSNWFVLRVFNIPSDLREAGVLVIQLTGLGFFLNMFTSLLEGLAMGMNHFEIPNRIRIFRVSLSSLFMVVAVFAGRGLTGVMAGNILGQVIATSTSAFFTFHLVPKPRFQGAISFIPELFSFGKYVFLSRGINQISSQLGSTVLGIFSTMTNLTYYDIPTRIIRIGMDVFQRLFEQLFPLSAGLNSQGKKHLLSEIFVSLLRWQLILMLPIFLLVLFFGRYAVRFWIGSDFVDNSYTILIVTVTYQISSVLTGVPSQYALGFGKPMYPTMFSFIRLLIISIFIYPLVQRFGALGASLTILIGSIQGIVFIFFVAKRLMDINLWSVLKRDLICLAVLLFVFAAFWFFAGDTIDGYSSILIQFIFAIILLTVYFGGVIVLGVLPLDQARLLLSKKFWEKA